MTQAIVFFDLDGTLFDNQKNVLPSSIQAIKQLQENDILPVIATGRSIFEIQYVLDATGIDSIVSSNGSFIQYAGQKLYAAVIAEDLLDQLTDFADRQHDPLGYFNNRAFRLSQSTQDTRDNYHLLRLDAVVDPTWYHTQEINFLNVFNRNKAELYQEAFRGEFDFVRNNPRALDTVLAGVTKQTGIRRLIKEAGLSGLPTYAFGDGYNDIEMFDEVDTPISMANGVAEVKARAKYVTTDNLSDGIVKGLRHFELI